MNILLVYAHPEPQSLNGALKALTVSQLSTQGHQVQISDLYAMNWKTVLNSEDRTDRIIGDRFDASLDSKQAFENGTQSVDIVAEQNKLLWADALILQFPLWWFSMPAIMKGWIDRVFAYGFAYGVGEHSETHWGDRYGEGTLAGKRAMLIVTAGGWESHYTPRGINGPIDDILFPIQHGVLFYPGFEVLPPYVVYQTGRMDQQRFSQTCAALALRLEDFWKTEPIAFYPQNYGAYSIPELTLKPEIEPDQSGFSVHIRK